ncbi:2760_t:CDS:1, partial [Scutellospora calospora]
AIYFFETLPRVTAFNGFSISLPNEVTILSVAMWVFYELGNLKNFTAARVFRVVDDIIIQFGLFSTIILSCFSSDESCEDV